jgi:hypothetical protein
MGSNGDPPRTWVLPGAEEPVPRDAGECAHESAQRLGGDAGGNVYYRCRTCHVVLIEEGVGSPQQVREDRSWDREESSGNPLTGLLRTDDEFERQQDDGAPDRLDRSAAGFEARVLQFVRRLRDR